MLEMSVGRVAQFRSAFRFRRLSGLGLDRVDPAALDAWGFHTRAQLHRAGVLRRMQRTRPRHGACQHHRRGALMMEIAIGEAHARDRAAERDLVLLVEIEARLERQASDRGANRLAANLQRIAWQTHVTDRAGAAELHRARRAAVLEHPACAAGAVKASETEPLARDE